jgi:aerobic-type carbon monoxide dehydrogenase small subunit (CoxS/CutS family)
MLQMEKKDIIFEEVVQLTVNGEQYRLNIQSNWTLSYVLRNVIGLTGTKEFCGQGACGACSVIIDKKAVLSCMTLAADCDQKAIETIEGIARSNHPLIEAYVKHHCMQCGFCTPGFIVTAKALLDSNPDPTEEEVKEALAGNLCRCGTYPQHIKAVLEASRQLRGG